MKTIKSNQTLTAKSICDNNCIFELEVIERKGNFATIKYNGKIRKTKVREFWGEEYLRPDTYSMAPTFIAIN
ncbi:MAG: hypothetical protein ACOYN4_04840 [Bacteroidales bacterium]